MLCSIEKEIHIERRKSTLREDQASDWQFPSENLTFSKKKEQAIYGLIIPKKVNYIFFFINNIKSDDTCFQLKIQDEMECCRLIDVDFCINKPGKHHSERMRNSPGIYQTEKEKLNNSMFPIFFGSWSFWFWLKLVWSSCGQKQDWWAKVSGSKRRPKIYPFLAGERFKVCPIFSCFYVQFCTSWDSFRQTHVIS